MNVQLSDLPRAPMTLRLSDPLLYSPTEPPCQPLLPALDSHGLPTASTDRLQHAPLQVRRALVRVLLVPDALPAAPAPRTTLRRHGSPDALADDEQHPRIHAPAPSRGRERSRTQPSPVYAVKYAQ